MNRNHVYPSGNTAYSRGSAGSLSISPHRGFQPRSQPALRRRRQLLIRLAIAGVASCFFIIIFFPSLRSTLIATVSLGLLSNMEDLQLETVRYYDLSNVGGTARGWEREERVLMCAPLRDAESHLPMFFSHLRNFTYPHHLIDLAFLVSDSRDKTLSLLSQMLNELQNDPDPKMPYGEISVLEKDFGQQVNQDVESRHGFAAQASRRKLMAQARNWLLSAALRPTHSWVYWRDVDVETAPFTILEDLMRHNKDVIVPNVWRPLPDWLGGEQPYDLNSWQESETALALADTLDEDAVIVEGYAEYATWRPHLAYLRDPYGDPDMEMEIDGVGGVSILAKAKVFRSGVHFPAFSFEKHAETEGFGKMAKRMQFSVVGLPHYTVWHLYEPSVDDIRHMEEMEQERLNREAEERERAERMKKIKEEFTEVGSQWDKDKSEIEGLSNSDETKQQVSSENDETSRQQNKVEEVRAETPVEKAAETGPEKDMEKPSEKGSERAMVKSPEKTPEKTPEKSLEKIEKIPEKSLEKSPEKSLEKSPEKSIEKSPIRQSPSPEKSLEKIPEKGTEIRTENRIEKGTKGATKSTENVNDGGTEKSPEKKIEKIAERTSERSLEKAPEKGSDRGPEKILVKSSEKGLEKVSDKGPERGPGKVGAGTRIED